MKRLNVFFTILFLGSLFVSCDPEEIKEDLLGSITIGSGAITNTIWIPNIPAAGTANLASVDISVNTDSLLTAEGITNVSLTSAEIKSVNLTIVTPATANFDVVDNAEIIFSGSSLNTVTVADISDITAGASSIDLNITDDVNVIDYLASSANGKMDLSATTNGPITDSLEVEVTVNYDITVDPI